MPVDYQLAKIYKIEALNPEHESDVYIGSTCEPSLAHRMAGHRRSYKHWKNGKYNNHVRSFDIFDKYGIEYCNILLLESYPCLNKDELRQREGYYIKNTSCINKNIPGRSTKEFQKQYRDNHKEHIKGYMKEYRDNHKEYLQTKFNCICGGCYTRDHKRHHVKSLKHINYITKHDDIIKKVNDLIISINNEQFNIITI